MTEIALFPIPGCVTFPATVFPLHVFEPRYRQMMKDCLENSRLVAICHTEKEVRGAKENQALKEALQSNQATYKPYPIFSAGKLELIRTLEDGRMILNVHMIERFEFIEETQTLPYSIAKCTVYEDESNDGVLGIEETLREYQQKILTRLTAMFHKKPEVISALNDEYWQTMDCFEFSFAIFGLVSFDAEFAQEILTMRSPVERLDTLLTVLNQQ